MNNHNNLTNEQKSILGFIVSLEKNIESEVFNFEKSQYKDYVRLSHRISFLDKRKKDYIKESENLDIPIENIKLFNKGVYTGLINPNKISYLAYWE